MTGFLLWVPPLAAVVLVADVGVFRIWRDICLIRRS